MLRAAWFPVTVILIVALWAFTRFGPQRDTGPAEPAMPAAVREAEARELYLTAGGKYTAADIAANGRMTAAERYRGFRARHDADPRPGDAVCPVTHTKANAGCTWIVDGKTYQFCCPPCIDEFVRAARERPEVILPPEAYIQR